MKKRLISLLLSLILILTSMMPAFGVLAKYDAKQVYISAEADSNISIKGDDVVPPEYDYNGNLYIYADSHNIERDYSQKASVYVTNYSEKTIEYYLVSKNPYDDLYMNFVRSGSIDSPLVIQAGESQKIELDIFAQNAKKSEYEIPVYAVIVDGEETIEDAKCTLNLYCDDVYFNFLCREIAVNESTLSKTLKLTNNGDALTDVTVSLEGQIADYVMLNPIVSNHKMNRYDSIEIKASPDLTKMKSNNASLIKGYLVVSSAGKSQKFELIFDTKGQEITSTTMGQLALKQSGNPYYNLEIDNGSIKASGEYNKNTGILDVSVNYDMLYGEQQNNRLKTKINMTGRPYTESEEKFQEEFTITCENGKYLVKIKTLVDTEQFSNMYKELDNPVELFRLVKKTDKDDGLSPVEKTAVEVSFEIVDEFGNVMPTQLSLAITLAESTDLYGKSIAVNCTPMYTAEQQSKFNAYATFRSILLAGDIIADVASLLFPGAGTAVAFGYKIASTILGNYLDTNIDEIFENPTAFNQKYLGFQCTNAGSITKNFYINDYIKYVKVVGVMLSPNLTKINIGETASLYADVYPDDATNKGVTWESSRPDVATVSSSGVVTGLKEGSTVITVRTVDGGHIDTASVIVRIPVEGVVLFPTEVEMYPGSVKYFVENVFPANATNKDVTWVSSNPEIATVDSNGMVTAICEGVAYITVETVDGKFTSTSTVTVKTSDVKASFDPAELIVPKGGTQATNIIISTDDEMEYEVESMSFESNNKSVATVDSDGVITGVDYGEATITATIVTNKGTVTCSAGVVVSKPVESVMIFDADTVTNLMIGESQNVLYSVYPTDAGNQAVTWSSSNESVATVDQNGTITAVGEGAATITVTTVEGNFKDTMTVDVSVAQPMAFALRSAAPQDTETNKGVGLFVTSRMYGGDGVNRWYGDSSTDYVDIADTTYTYTLNGKKVGVSHNSGVTDLSIVEIPVEHLRFGANNTLVCDYDTNPGHYFVNTDTQITITYPADTPISYIGTPADLQDVRALPDYAIYSENIFGDGKNVVIGNEIEVSFNVYNRGSMGGWFDIVVTDKNGTIYEEENHYLDAFAGDVISFKWTPEYTSEDLTVTLTNKSVGIDERSSENNQATRTFVARERIKPVIKSITPDYLVEGNGTLVATLSSYEDVTDVKFYIDDACCEGEVKSSNINGDKRYWINCNDMAEGTCNIKVVVTYINGKDTTDTVEKKVSLNVLDKDWNKYKFNIDESATEIRCYIFDIDNNYYYSIYDFSRMGTECTLTITKDIFDNLANYYLCIRTNEGFMFKNMADIGEGFIFDECKTLTFVEDENLRVSDISLVKFDDNYIGTWMSDSNMYLTPGKYVFNVGFYYYDEYRSAEIEIDLSDDNVVVDLSEYVTKYKFKFADEIQGDVNSALWYKNKYDDSWYSLDLIQVVEEDIFVLMPYVDDEYELEYADEMFVSITTDDISFIYDIDLSDDISTDIISISKSKLQKYKMSANDGSSDFRMREVLVENDKLLVILYAETIYLTPGEYDITVTYKDAEVTEPIMMTMSARTVADEVQSRDLQNKKLLVKWADAYQGTNAYIYALGENGTGTGYNNVTSGKEIVIADDVYNIKTNLVRNESRFTISSYIDTYSDADVTIGNKFVGAITNTFATYKPSSNVTLYIDDLYDENGNELIEYISNGYEDSLYGNVVLTNINDENEQYCIPISLDNINSVDIELPESTGEFTIKLEAYTISDLILPELPEEPVIPEVPAVVESIQLNAYDITLNCCGRYQLIADQLPEEAEDCKLVWYSSDERIATVDENGLVTAGKNVKGCATITVMTEDGLIKAECKVTVKFTFVQWLIWFFTFGCIRDFISKLVG